MIQKIEAAIETLTVQVDRGGALFANPTKAAKIADAIASLAQARLTLKATDAQYPAQTETPTPETGDVPCDGCDVCC